uniref:Uncharacterized protein n=1 Tax=Triticum aestivum TaxID=4565 RepID=A0A077S710_WHEAT|nr:unnamed protein product [Triticum aestivum]
MKKAKLPASSSSAGHTTRPLLSLPRTPSLSQQTPVLSDPDPSPPLAATHPSPAATYLQHLPLTSLPPTSATPPLPTSDPLPTPRSNLPPENEEVAARNFAMRWSSTRGHDAGPSMEAVVDDAVSKLLKAGIALSEISSAPGLSDDALEGEDGLRWQAASCLGLEDEDEGGGERAWVVVLKVSLHYKVCTGKVKKHLTKMEGEHQHLLKFGDKIMHLESWEDQLLTNNMSLEDMLQQCSNLN